MRLIFPLLHLLFAGSLAWGASEQPFHPRSPAVGETLFETVDPAVSGLDFPIPLSRDHPQRYVYHSSNASSGIAIGDVDGNGLPDIFISGTAYPNRLYLQRTPFEFEDVTKQAGIVTRAWGAGVSMADVDGDGHLDIYLCNYHAANELWINDGKGGFTEQAAAFGLDLKDGSLFAAFADYDQDGDLDVYVVTYRLYYPTGRPKSVGVQHKPDGRVGPLEEYWDYFALVYQEGVPVEEWDFSETGRPDKFYRNNGDRTFTDISATVGISPMRGYGNTVLWWDYDDDGWLDLLVGNDFQDPDWLFRNRGDGSFEEVLREATPQSTWYTMGAGTGDLNRDGRIDAFVTDMAASSHFVSKVNMGVMDAQQDFLDSSEPRQFMRNALYLNTGTRRLMEAGYLSGMAKTDWSWAVHIGDLDHDGLPDLYLTNGMVRDFMNSDLPQLTIADVTDVTYWALFEDKNTRPERNFAYRNKGDLDFEDVSKAWGLDHLRISYSAARADLDRDGDLDFVVCNVDDRIMLLRNNNQQGNALLVRLEGADGNTRGIGAKVEIRAGGRSQVAMQSPYEGFMSSNEELVHFGLGPAATIDELVVTWPRGKRQVLKNIPANQVLTVKEAGEAFTPKQQAPMFTRSRALRWVRHAETPFDDFENQPLLPQKISQFGPGLAWADVNGDGLEDVYFCGAAGQAGELHLHQTDHSFRWKAIPDSIRHAADEEMSALFFDADGDSDADLLVVTGSVEFEVGDARYRDRLYLNDGKGVFTPAPDGTLPDLRDSGSTACAVDFDRDGDLDLFIASRAVPGSYPASPESRLLRNERGRFIEVGAEQAPGLARCGMVNGALWSDANDDGWPDLVLAIDWGPVRVFLNHEGTLRDATNEAGTSGLLGWWNGIAASDVDHDGDMDYLVTNFGYNTKYKASAEKPVELYFHDFDQSGRKSLVESYYEKGKKLPVRGLSCMSNRMHYIKDKFGTYTNFAQADLPEILTEEALKIADHWVMNTLSSGLLINDGKAGFSFKPLPRICQVAPGFGVVFADVNADGHPDAYIAQNFFHPQRETPRMGGGLSQLLLGQGDGTLVPVDAKTSGLIAPVDATALARTDLNGDGWIDFVLAANNDRLHAFQSAAHPDHQPLRIQLRGPAGNPTAAGARVTLRAGNLAPQRAEVHAGHGYLSQSGPAISFGRGMDGGAVDVEVRWPDGSRSKHRSEQPDRLWVIEKPSS